MSPEPAVAGAPVRVSAPPQQLPAPAPVARLPRGLGESWFAEALDTALVPATDRPSSAPGAVPGVRRRRPAPPGVRQPDLLQPGTGGPKHRAAGPLDLTGAASAPAAVPAAPASRPAGPSSFTPRRRRVDASALTASPEPTLEQTVGPAVRRPPERRTERAPEPAPEQVPHPEVRSDPPGLRRRPVSRPASPRIHPTVAPQQALQDLPGPIRSAPAVPAAAPPVRRPQWTPTGAGSSWASPTVGRRRTLRPQRTTLDVPSALASTTRADDPRAALGERAMATQRRRQHRRRLRRGIWYAAVVGSLVAAVAGGAALAVLAPQTVTVQETPAPPAADLPGPAVDDGADPP